MTKTKYLGSVIGLTGELDETLSDNVTKTKRSLHRLHPIIGSLTLIRLIELFIESVAIYGLSTIGLRIKDNNSLVALQKIIKRRMILGLKSRKTKKTKKTKKKEELKEEFEMSNLAAKLLQRRLKLWNTLKRDQENLVLTILESKLGTGVKMRISYSRSWRLQVENDAKKVWKEKAVNRLNKSLEEPKINDNL